MVWLIVLAGIVVAVFAILLMFGETGFGIQPGQEDDFDDEYYLLPPRLDSLYKGNRWLQSNHMKAYKAFSKGRIDEAIRIQGRIRERFPDSAVIEGNTARLIGYKCDQYGNSIPGKDYQDLRNFTEYTAGRAKELFDRNPHRYAPEVGSFLRKLLK
jgi:hypothetical protein